MKINLDHIKVFFGGFVAVFMLQYLALHSFCKEVLCFRESMATFYYDFDIFVDTLWRVGGVAQCVALFVQQFFTDADGAAIVLDLLFTPVTLLLAWGFKRLTGHWWVAPLAVLPLMSQSLLLDNPGYNLSGTVGMMLVICLLAAVLIFDEGPRRLVAALVACFLCWYMAAQSALLLAVAIVMVELVKCRCVFALCYLMCVVEVFVMALISCRLSVYPSLELALTPQGYYVQWAYEGAQAWSAWVEFVVTLAIVLALSFVPGKHGRLLLIISLVYVAARLVFWSNHHEPYAKRDFIELSNYIAKEWWSKVLHRYKSMPQDDATLQSCANLALAQRGELAKTMLRHANNGVAALYNASDKSPYSYMLQSDIYYAMGLVATAKRYAFEANEALGNLSPRMLKRLIDTNLITGNYQVAEKYINLLCKTRRYKRWAQERRAMLYDDKAIEADAALGVKRACLFDDNRFMGQHGLDDDLMQVVRANPQYTTAFDYLGMVYLLGRNVPKFIDVLGEASALGAVTLPLPEHFQEAVAMASFATGDDLATQYQIHPSVLDKCRAFWAQHQPQPNTLWQYLRSARDHASTPASDDTIDYYN